MLTPRRATAIVLMATAVATLSACGVGDDSSSASRTIGEITGADLVAVCSNSGYADAYPEQCAGVVGSTNHMDEYMVSIDAFNASAGTTIARTLAFGGTVGSLSPAPVIFLIPTQF